MNIELQIKPLSVNKLYNGQRTKSKLYNKYARDISFLLPNSKQQFSDMLRVEIFFGFSTKAADIDNCCKGIIDIVSKKYGFNDNRIYELNLRKCIVPKGKEFISIQIENLLPFDLQNPK